MKSQLLIAIAIASFGVATTEAFATCSYQDDVSGNCKDAAKDYFNKTEDSQGSSYEHVEQRVQSARDVLKECQNCAEHRIEESLRNITTEENNENSN